MRFRTATVTLTLLAIGLCLVAARPANALVINWQLDAATPGDWFVAGNWLPTVVPGTGDTAVVDNTGTVQISAGDAQAQQIYLGQAAGADGSLEISGGTVSSGPVYVGYAAGSSGSLEIGGGTVTSGHVYAGYEDGSSGSVTLSDGTVNLGGNFIVRRQYAKRRQRELHAKRRGLDGFRRPGGHRRGLRHRAVHL